MSVAIGARRRSRAEGYFAEDSIVRRVHRERILSLAGPRALLMQAAHPLAVTGLLAHSTALEEPYDRLSRTAEVLNLIIFGARRDADRVTAQVRSMHRRVHGRLPESAGKFPAGTAYRADDPALLLWILYTLVDSNLLVHERYVGGLSDREGSAYWQDYKVIGELFGLTRAQMPETLEELRAYGREMLQGDTLVLTDWARSRARKIVLEPPLPLALRPALELVNFITIALLPGRIRDQYGFSALPPPIVRALLVRAGAEYVKRLVLPALPAGIRRAHPEPTAHRPGSRPARTVNRAGPPSLAT